ncbi:MAG TPA: macro domain-containing protein [Bdellovibrio sp.]|nr:macro domain-containing protein [Bdellovibrio sp.]
MKHFILKKGLQANLTFLMLISSQISYAGPGAVQYLRTSKMSSYERYSITQPQQASLLCPKQAINFVWQENHLAPLGCASITSSGDMQNQGIKYILHASTGSMGSYDDSTEPTLKSITDAIKSSILLAKSAHVHEIAIPLIGGKIFLSRIKEFRNSNEPAEKLTQELAYNIVKAAYETDDSLTYTFVGYSEQDTAQFKEAKQELVTERSIFVKIKFWLQNYFGSGNFSTRAKVVQGDITQFETHHAQAIINAANMELQFGGGLSGVIARASGNAQEIDQANAELIQQYYRLKQNGK